MRPSLRLLVSHPAHFISLGLGSGLAPKAPGTFGSLAAWALFALLPVTTPVSFLVGGIVLSFALGCWLIPVTSRALGQADPGSIVWDEFVAVWLVLAFTPWTFAWQAFAVITFRVFDIAKPWPIRWADGRFKNGFGVMFDDLLAAGYTLICVALALYLVPMA
ncbi:MAG: phosphatidylglycerophosphatase A [Rhodocyclaceae bacterium]